MKENNKLEENRNSRNPSPMNNNPSNDVITLESEHTKKKMLTVAEYVVKLDEIQKILADYQNYKERLENIENKIQDINMTIKNVVSQSAFERELKLYSGELTQKIDSNQSQLNDSISNFEKNQLSNNTFKNTIQGQASIDKLEKYIHQVYELKMSIEKSVESKYKDDLSKLEIQLNQKLEQADLAAGLDSQATKLDLQSMEINVDEQDFENKGKKLKKFVKKIVNEELKSNEQIKPNETDDESSEHSSELADSIEGNNMQFKFKNNSMKKLDNQSAIENDKKRGKKFTPTTNKLENSIAMNEVSKNLERDILNNDLDPDNYKSQDIQNQLDGYFDKDISKNPSALTLSNQNPHSNSLEIIEDSTAQGSRQNLLNDMSASTFKEEEPRRNKRKNRKTVDKDIQKEQERGNSPDSSASKPNELPGVNPLIIKGITERMDSINKNIEEIYQKANDGQNRIAEFTDAFWKLKKRQEEESDSRQELESKIANVNKIVNNMEVQYNASSQQQKAIDQDLTILRDNSNRIHEFANQLEANMNRDRDHTLKVIVTSKILAQETKTMLNKGMTDVNKRIDKIAKSMEGQHSFNVEINQNVAQIDSEQTKKQSVLSEVINKLTNDIEYLKKPFLEYIELLNGEQKHLQEEIDQNRVMINKHLKDSEGKVKKHIAKEKKMFISQSMDLENSKGLDKESITSRSQDFGFHLPKIHEKNVNKLEKNIMKESIRTPRADYSKSKNEALKKNHGNFILNKYNQMDIPIKDK